MCLQYELASLIPINNCISTVSNHKWTIDEFTFIEFWEDPNSISRCSISTLPALQAKWIGLSAYYENDNNLYQVKSYRKSTWWTLSSKELYCYEFNVDLTIIIYTSDISSTDTPHSLTKYSTTEVNPFKAAEWIGWNPPYNQLCLTDDTSQYTYYWYHFSFCSRIHIIFYN